MPSKYFNQNPSISSTNFLVIPNKNNPRLVISLLSYSLFKTGLSLHNTASAKNKIIKKIITFGFPLYKYFNTNVISLKENVIELLNILESKQQSGKLYYSSFYVGTADNANRKITSQICNSDENVLGILKIPLAAESEKFITAELDIINGLKQYNFQSFIFPVSSFLLTESPQKVVFQEDVFKDSKPIKNSISDIVFEASCELAIKTINKNSTEYLKKLIEQINNLELNSELRKFIKQSAEKVSSADIPTVLIHGDYVKYNMKEKEGKLVLIDWEFARTGLPLYDLFHFVFQGKYQIEKKDELRCIKEVFKNTNIAYYKTYLNKLKINFDDIKSLFILYLCDSLIFEKKIKPDLPIKNSQYHKTLKLLTEH